MDLIITFPVTEEITQSLGSSPEEQALTIQRIIKINFPDSKTSFKDLQVGISIPQSMKDSPLKEIEQSLKETFIVELYREFKITRNQVRLFLHLTFKDNELFLEKLGLPRSPTEPNYEVDENTGETYFRKS